MAIQFVTEQFKDDAITQAKIADDAVGADQLAANAVVSASIVSDAITQAKIADDAVGADQLAANAVVFASVASSAYETNLASSASSSKLVTAAASKAYADSVASGLDLKESCMVASTGNLTLSGTQTIDGVAVTAGKRVLVKDQSTGTQNGIYVCAAGAWSRASDFDTGAAEAGAFTFVEQGTVNGDNGFVCTNNAGSDVVGTDALTFTQFSGAGQITAGDGLAKSGNTLSVNVDDSSLEISSDALQVKASGITNAMLAGSIANAKLSNSTVSYGGVSLSLGGSDATPAFDLADATNYPTSSLVGTITNAQLAGSIANAKLANSTISGVALGANLNDLTVDDSSIQLNSGTTFNGSAARTISIKASGVTNAMLAGSIADSKLSQITTADKVAGSAVELGSNSAIGNDSGLMLKPSVAGDGLGYVASGGNQVLSVGVDDSSIEINSDSLRVKASGITNAMLAGSIADSKLSTISTAGKVDLAALEIDGGTDIGADLVDADLMIVDDGAGGTNRKSALSRVKKYIYSAMSGDATASDAGVLTIGSDAVEQSMIADDAVGADQLAANAVVTASIVDANVTFAKAAFTPHQEAFTANGSTTAFNLTNRIALAAWRQSIIVFRNGQKINFSGSASDASEYSISDDGSTTTVTLGAAPASGEVISLFYIYE